MAVFDFSDPSIVLPAQIVVDSSLLLALRADDDNPHAEAARAFTQRMAEQIAALTLVAWVPLPVLQECYHTILAAGVYAGPGRRWTRADGRRTGLRRTSASRSCLRRRSHRWRSSRDC